MQHTTIAMSREQARLKPSAIAWSAPGKDWTFAEVESLTNRLAQGLRATGLGRGDRVATLTHHQPECAILTLAAQKIGAVCMPVNWRLAGPEVEYILNDGQARFLMTDAEFLPTLASLNCPSLKTTVLTLADPTPQKGPTDLQPLTRIRIRASYPRKRTLPCSFTRPEPPGCPRGLNSRVARWPQPL